MPSRTKTRTERAIAYQEIRRELSSLGYHTLRPLFLDRWMRYRLLVVAVNHLAWLLNRDPLRVYQALLCRAERTVKGIPYCRYKQARATQGALIEGREKLEILCPKCGAPLLDAGPATEAEVRREIDYAVAEKSRRERERILDAIRTTKEPEKNCRQEADSGV